MTYSILEIIHPYLEILKIHDDWNLRCLILVRCITSLALKWCKLPLKFLFLKKLRARNHIQVLDEDYNRVRTPSEFRVKLNKDIEGE